VGDSKRPSHRSVVESPNKECYRGSVITWYPTNTTTSSIRLLNDCKEGPDNDLCSLLVLHRKTPWYRQIPAMLTCIVFLLHRYLGRGIRALSGGRTTIIGLESIAVASIDDHDDPYHRMPRTALTLSTNHHHRGLLGLIN